MLGKGHYIGERGMIIGILTQYWERSAIYWGGHYIRKEGF